MLARIFGSFVAFALLLVAPLAVSAADEGFDRQAFEKAQAEGKPIVLEFHAPWCPTCRKQKPVLQEILARDDFSRVVHLVADYDTSSDLKNELAVRQQGTVIIFQGSEERSRSIGVTDKEELEAEIAKALN